MARPWYLAWLAVPVLVLSLGYWVWQETAPSAATNPELDDSRPRPQGDSWSGVYPEPATLNPFTTQGAVARRYVLRYTHDTLMDLDPETAALRPALAETVVSSEDGLRHEFVLRGGVRFSDGRPLEMEDVLFAHALGSNPELPVGALGQVLGLLASVEAVDERTVRLTLTEGTARAFGLVATGYPVVSARYFRDEVARLAAEQSQAMPPSERDGAFGSLLAQVRMPGPGTGPYQLGGSREEAARAWRDGIDLTLVQNPRSWRRAAHPTHWNLEKIHLRFLDDPAAARVALRQQEIDWVLERDPERALEDPVIAASYRPVVYDHIYLGHFAILWNHRRSGLSDPRVRRALTMAFDRDAIVRGLMKGRAQPAACWFKPGQPETPAEIQPLPFDPAAARMLLQEAGFDPAANRPLRVSLIYASSEELHRQIVELAEPAFARAGVELDLQPMEFSGMVARLGDRDFDAMLVVKSLERWVDPYPMFHSSQAERGSNWMGYANPEVDRLLEEARAELDDAKRADLYREFNRHFFRDQPVTLLAHELSSVLLHRRFRGADPGALGLFPESWWVEPGDQLAR